MRIIHVNYKLSSVCCVAVEKNPRFVNSVKKRGFEVCSYIFFTLVKMPPEKKVLWIYSFGQEWNIFILPFLDTLGYTLFKRYGVWPGQFFSFFGCFGEPCSYMRESTGAGPGGSEFLNQIFVIEPPWQEKLKSQIFWKLVRWCPSYGHFWIWAQKLVQNWKQQKKLSFSKQT